MFFWFQVWRTSHPLIIVGLSRRGWCTYTSHAIIVTAGELSDNITLNEVKARHTITIPIHDHQMIILATKSVATIVIKASPQIMA